jgi:hypothetical protein
VQGQIGEEFTKPECRHPQTSEHFEGASPIPRAIEDQKSPDPAGITRTPGRSPRSSLKNGIPNDGPSSGQSLSSATTREISGATCENKLQK